MKKVALALLFSSVASTVYAQMFMTEKTMVCDNAQKIMKALLAEEFKEMPIWMGKSDQDDSKYSLFSNEKTKSWTILQFNDKIACVLGTGTDSNSLDLGTKTKLQF
jgi:hypothetical protein